MINIMLSMTKLNTLLLTLLLIHIASPAITDFWNNDPVDSATLECLQQTGYLDEAFVLAEFNPTNQRWQTYVQPAQVKQTGTTPHLVLSTSQITGRLPPQLEAHRIHRQFQEAPILKYWINLSNFPSSFRPTCQYLKTLAHYLELYSKKQVGIQTEQMFWVDLFGNSQACPELAAHELFLSFNNFKPFGGWTDYSYYETYQVVNACGYPGMQVFKN